MSPRGISLGMGAVAVAVAALFLLIGFPLTDSTPDRSEALDDATKDRRARDAAAARIAAESDVIDEPGPDDTPGSDRPGVAVSAPPGFVPASHTHDEPAPPPGYSFTTYHEVEQAPMTAADFDPDAGLPADPPDWMDFGQQALADQAAASGRDWTYGWVKLARDADLEALRESLAAQRAELLGHAGDLARVRLPADADRLRAIAAADAVAGIGAVPADRKITDTLVELAQANIEERVPVWITLMDDDRDGRWRYALKNLGAEVGRFDPAIRTYAANIPLHALRPLAEADFVLAIESIGAVETTLEIAAPAMGADAVRSYDESAGTFVGVGGSSVTVAVMDTGLNVDHPDISTNRRSICGANFTDFLASREEDQDLWFDADGHGTHVTGIVVGNGAANPDRVGMAPLVRDIRFAKAVSSFGTASALGWNRAMDWLATPTACGDGVPRKALVINSSLGAGSDAWEGRSVVERKIDASVWAARQLFVTSAGNAAHVESSSMAGAKNALAVGAAQNIGDIAVFSSTGPTRDGRLLPKIVGTGVQVASAAGAGSRAEYNVFSGTSMSSPSVVGVAALVMDAVPALREEPAALRARLMASAIKPDAFLGDSGAFPRDNTRGPGRVNDVYGLGKVSARTAVLTRDEEDGWTGGTVAFDVDPESYAYRDIVVPEGASRLDIVMTWDEPPADTITSPVLHDLDLWVDWQVSCGQIAACGEFHSLSKVDNVEWVVVPNPPAGVYRLKVRPNRIYGPPPRAGLAWTVIRGDSTPALAVVADAEEIRVAPGESFDVEVTLTTGGYVAAGANLRIDCRTETGSDACDGISYEPKKSGVRREDGLGRTLARDGATVVVGEIGPEEQQTVFLRVAGRGEGAFRLDFAASAWNAVSASTSVSVVVGNPDSAPPVSDGRPANDDFADAARLEGDVGETTFDLVAATPEPGEPYFPFGGEHPSRERSLWYVWTAPENGAVRFAVAQAVAASVFGPPADYADNIVVQVFPDGPIARLAPIGLPQLGGGTAFFAEKGETYRIRLAVGPEGLATDDRPAAMPDLSLLWGPGNRPENDDYALAASIEGDSGAVDGNNQGATTEPAELMGDSNPTTPLDASGWAGSVWYRWTAPATGDYRFAASRRSTMVAAFVGDTVATARMVSGVPRTAPEAIVFPATEGVEYRIGVATGSAHWSGAPFELSWSPGARTDPANDDFAAAEPTFGDTAFGNVAFDDMTVEGMEPAGSGVRTAWWTWQPQADGRYTWLVERLRDIAIDEVPLQMSIFAGDELASLELVGTDPGDETMQLQMAFDARADTVYRVALGLPRDAAQVSFPPTPIIMQWGATPDNDDVDNAAALAGASGSVSGSNEFGTTEKGERTGSLGDSSVWWTWAPEETGWMRFAVDGPGGSKLAVYRVGDDGALELLTVSRRLGDTVATFRAEQGTRYVIRLGTYYYDAEGSGGAGRGPFELSWTPSEAPALLRYVASVEAGQMGDGVPVPPVVFGDLALNAAGTELYAAAAEGGPLLVFKRDAATGKLTLFETLWDTPLERGARLVWDDAGSALVAAGCGVWLKFAPRTDGGLEPAGVIDGAPCAAGSVIVVGDFMYHVMAPWMIETYRFDDAHDALNLEDAIMIPGVSSAVMTADGGHLYSIARDPFGDQSLAAIERDADTGALQIATTIEGGDDGDGPRVEQLTDVQAMAVHDSHLFLSVGYSGVDTIVFDLADRAAPAYAGIRPSFADSSVHCTHALARSNVAAVDVVCRGQTGELFTVQVGRDGSPFGSDRVVASGDSRDGFGNPVPGNGAVGSIVGSPDGRHLYVAGAFSTFVFDPESGFFGTVDLDQLLAFERVYQTADETPE